MGAAGAGERLAWEAGAAGMPMHACACPPLLACIDPFDPFDIQGASPGLSRAMGKRKPVSILKRAQQQEPRPAKKQKTQQPVPGEQSKQAPNREQKQQQNRQGQGGGGSGGSARRDHNREPPGLRPTSAVHAQAANAVRRLLEADASKRGGVTLKSLTLAPHITAKKASRAAGFSAAPAPLLVHVCLQCVCHALCLLLRGCCAGGWVLHVRQYLRQVPAKVGPRLCYSPHQLCLSMCLSMCLMCLAICASPCFCF